MVHQHVFVAAAIKVAVVQVQGRMAGGHTPAGMPTGIPHE
jgi:hypothetical protein